MRRSPSLSSSTSTLRPTRPVATRDGAHADDALLRLLRQRVDAPASVMLPLPTPAITIPFAPAATAASISAPSMFS